MTFLWPYMLAGLIIVPLVIALYLEISQQRLSLAARFGGRPPAGNARPGFRRHIPPLLFLLSLVIVLVALARPQARVTLPHVEGTVILVFDVSGSMVADDVKPSRLEAAKGVARDFVNRQPSTVKIGVVSFSGSGFTIQTPTNDTNLVLAAINRLQPTTATSIGQGILAALNTIAVEDGLKTAGQIQSGGVSPTQSPDSGSQPGASQVDLLALLPDGPYPSSTILLLSDGENNESIDPLVAAQTAAEHQVPIDTLGFGTTAGTIIKVNGFTLFTAMDEALLKQIAQVTGGTYLAGQDEQNLQSVYASLTPHLVVKPETMEVTALFAGAGLVTLLIGSLLSMVWFNRVL